MDILNMKILVIYLCFNKKRKTSSFLFSFVSLLFSFLCGKQITTYKASIIAESINVQIQNFVFRIFFFNEYRMIRMSSSMKVQSIEILEDVKNRRKENIVIFCILMLFDSYQDRLLMRIECVCLCADEKLLVLFFFSLFASFLHVTYTKSI